ncbi:hypothetical protein AM500_07405 [Bacillus sp. FJAT-18017]|nr:hypothetical protein AM500_07405 [Bacillus sp. FJAT-18017]
MNLILIGAEGAKDSFENAKNAFLLWCFSGTIIQRPVGAAGQVRPHRRKAPRRLTARPTESEAPGAEIKKLKLISSSFILLL